MRAIAFVFIILITGIIPTTVSAAGTPPVYPGMGGAPSEVLTNMYPTVKGNAAIMGFIGECGVGSWHEEQMNADFKTAHLTPANSCGNQLVFSIRKSAGRDDPARIADVWIIGAGETWSGSMVPLNPSGGTSWIPGLPYGTRIDPVFVVACAAIAAGLIAVLFRMIQREM